MAGQTTQSRYPWRTVTRTVFQVGFALASLIPVIALAGGIDTKAGVVQVLAVCAAVTRIMAVPAVNEFLRTFAPWLATDSLAPEPNARELAELAYNAYGLSTGWKNFQGNPMPAWAGLPVPIQDAWVAGVGAARRAIVKPPVRTA